MPQHTLLAIFKLYLVSGALPGCSQETRTEAAWYQACMEWAAQQGGSMGFCTFPGKENLGEKCWGL